MAEIDENIVRNELTALERGEQLLRRKELYEAIHPEARNGGDRKTGRSERQDVVLNSFAWDTATKTNVSPRTIQREVQIAKKITEPVKHLIRETPVADDQKALLEIARKPPGKQREAAREAIDKKTLLKKRYHVWLRATPRMLTCAR